MSIATLFSNVAARLFGTPSASGAETVGPELLHHAVETIINAVDPRLHVVSGYHNKMAPAVARTIVAQITRAKSPKSRPPREGQGDVP